MGSFVQPSLIVLSVVTFALISILPERFECANLNDDGGYEILLAISRGTIEPDDPSEFIDNIEENLQEFSEIMHSTTDGRFYVKSATLIIPYHWELEPERNIIAADTENYLSADIRLSKSIVVPHVENPISCGFPGSYINLPLNFFHPNSTSYGEQKRSLLMAWARYRWGVWEEHGYPGDPKFPYFYQPTPGSPWTPTGCSDDGLVGDIIDVTSGEACEESLGDELYPPDGKCRFEPDTEDQVATSSLTYFPWLPTMSKFCTETNHNRLAPNKQNLYCGYKSGSEVIKTSYDSTGLSSPTVPSVPPIEFALKTENRKPLLYLLVDTSYFVVPEQVFKDIITEVRTLFSNEVLAGISAKAAIFPSNSGSNIDEIIPWSPVLSNTQQFNEVIERFQTGQSDNDGSFALALEEVIDDLSGINNPAGAVILILKHGVTSDAFGSAAYEREMIAKLRANNIVLHALEIQENLLTPKLHLQSASVQSGGSYLPVKPDMEISGQVGAFITKIVDRMELDEVIQRSSETVFMGYIPVDQEFSIPLQNSNLPDGTQVHFALTVDRAVDYPVTSLISLIQGPENAEIELLSVGYEWNEPSNEDNRLLIQQNMTLSGVKYEQDWKFKYTGCTPEASCTALLLVTYELPSGSFVSDDDLSIEVSVSQEGLPVKIFAKIMIGDQPVIGIDSVTASLHSDSQLLSILVIPLLDNGPNDVDAISEDGVYSGAIVPPEDGQYSLTVTVAGQKVARDFLIDHVHRDAAVQSLLPVDQKVVGCSSLTQGCSVVGLDRSLLKFQMQPESVVVTGTASVGNRAGRILDLDVVALDDFRARLTWTVPKIFSVAEIPEVDLEYEIHTSEEFDDLRIDFTNAGAATVEDPEGYAYVPGQQSSVVVSSTVRNPIYFAVRLKVKTGTGTPGDPSNIVRVVLEQSPSTTTTTTTTAAPPTRKTSTSTTEGFKTTTTTEPPDASSTVEPEEENIKHWYKTKEGVITLSVFAGGIVLILAGLVVKGIVKKLMSNNWDGEKQKLTEPSNVL